MNYLPIVVRELQVAARQPKNHWIRMAAPLGAMLICGSLLASYSTRALAPGLMGSQLFLAMSGLCYYGSLFAGLVFTADCLSGERREGTLGLLFLTKLSGWDVVLGKLAVTSLHAFYLLMGVFPLLAAPILLGSVTGGNIVRMTVGLINTLFFSLAAGMYASSISHQRIKALMITCGLIVAITCGGWQLVLLWFMFDLLGPFIKAGSPQGFSLWRAALVLVGFGLVIVIIWLLVAVAGIALQFLWLPSPAFAFFMAFDPAIKSAPGAYWWSLALTHSLSWGLLALASRSVLQSYDGMKVVRETGIDSWDEEPPDHLAPQNEATGAAVKVGDQHPVFWLASRDRRLQGLVLFLFILYIVVQSCISIAEMNNSIVLPSLALSMLRFFPFAALAYLLALQASRCFAEARDCGVLELLLTTPVNREDILREQWKYLEGMFLKPFLVAEAIQGGWILLSALLYSDSSKVWPFLGLRLLVETETIAASITVFYAIGWTALWQSWSGRKTMVSSAKTVVLVVVLPFVVLNFTPLYSLRMHASLNGVYWLSWAMVCLFDFGPQLAWLHHGRNQLKAALLASQPTWLTRRSGVRHVP